MTPTFTQDWLNNKTIIPYWEKVLVFDKPIDLLEVGCYEGRSTLWFLEHLPIRCLTVVDTFEGDPQQRELGVDQDFKGRFFENISEYKYKMKILESSSQVVLPKFSLTFDCIYIDGSHLQEHVLADAHNAFKLLKPGGILIFDDYSMNAEQAENYPYRPKTPLDLFLSLYEKELEVLVKDWQLIIKKL